MGLRMTASASVEGVPKLLLPHRQGAELPRGSPESRGVIRALVVSGVCGPIFASLEHVPTLYVDGIGNPFCRSPRRFASSAFRWNRLVGADAPGLRRPIKSA